MNKKPWESKTLWVSLLSAAAAFFPQVQEWISSHSEVFAMGLSGLFAVLRLVSGGKIVISDLKVEGKDVN